MANSQTISLWGYNPYAYAFPEFRRVLSRDAVLLAKHLRAQGLEVSVEPNDSSPLAFVTRKGFVETVSDPLFLTVLSVPIGLATNLLYDWLKTKLAVGTSSVPGHLVLFESESGKPLVYDPNGNPAKDNILETVESLRAKRFRQFKALEAIKSPYPHLPSPILLEHAPTIAAWGRLEWQNHEFVVTEAVVINRKAQAMVASGRLKGFSIAGLTTKMICSVCASPYFDCPHVANEAYGEDVCSVELSEMKIAEISLVRSPVNPLCRFRNR